MVDGDSGGTDGKGVEGEVGIVKRIGRRVSRQWLDKGGSGGGSE